MIQNALSSTRMASESFFPIRADSSVIDLIVLSNGSAFVCILLMVVVQRRFTVRQWAGSGLPPVTSREGMLQMTATWREELPSPRRSPGDVAANVEDASCGERPAPGLLGMIERAKHVIGRRASNRVSALLRRPRFLRGPYTEERLDATPIHTPRLILRPHSLSDAERWYQLQSNPEVVQHLPWSLRSREESLAHLRTRTTLTRVWQSDDLLALAVVRNGELIGDVSLQLRSVTAEVRTVELGWIIDPRHGGQGFATEASLVMANLAFTQLGAKIVTAVIRPANVRSIALAQRIGFIETHRDEANILYTLTLAGFHEALVRQPALRELLGSPAPGPIEG